MKFGLLAGPVGSLKLMQSSFGMIRNQGSQPYLRDFLDDAFHYGLCLDVYEMISSKHGIMIYTT